MSEQPFHVGLLVAALAVAGWVFGIHGHAGHSGAPDAHPTSESPLSVIPPGSAFVLSADIAQLRQAPLSAVLAERLRRLGPSTGDLASLCGFDPLTALDQLALAVPSAGAVATEHADDFGVVATGHFSAAQITRCATATITKRGGDPVGTELGAFSSVRDRTNEGGEVAARDGGPLIVSGGNYFRALLDAAEGHAERREHEDPRDAQHAELRRALGPGAIVASWLLPTGWFERMAGDDSARLSPLRGLKALGARLDVNRELRISVLVECADAASSTEVAALFDEVRASLGALALDPTLSAVAERVAVARDGARLRLDLILTEAEVDAVLALVLGSSGPAAPAHPPAPISSTDILQIPAR